MKKKLRIHYDDLGDYLEIMFGEPKPSYYEDLGNDNLVRKDEETDEIIGFAFWNVKKRQERTRDIEIELPAL